MQPRPFREVWAVDFEFAAPPGENPRPHTCVARELNSGRLLRLSQHELEAATTPPYDIGPDCLFVAYYASAEMGCHLALNWPVPANILDLFTEFRNLTNICTKGEGPPCGNGLLGALAYFGFDGIAAGEKQGMQELAMRGGPYTASETAALLDYCQTDVDALAKLYPAMLPRIDMPRALLRGKYMAAAAFIERNGTPIDMPTLTRLRGDWDGHQGRTDFGGK